MSAPTDAAAPDAGPRTFSKDDGSTYSRVSASEFPSGDDWDSAAQDDPAPAQDQPTADGA